MKLMQVYEFILYLAKDFDFMIFIFDMNSKDIQKNKWMVKLKFSKKARR